MAYLLRANTWLLSSGSKLLGGMESGVKRGWTSVGRWFGGLKTRVVGYLTKANKWLFSSGSNLLSGLKDGLLDKLSDAK